jgi:hypothetical protein
MTNAYTSAFCNKETNFKFRNRNYSFFLSHGLFSSADIDTGTKLLLKIFSKQLDEDLKNNKPLPRQILDAGSGIGVMGICAAGALESLGVESFHVRAQDRDELARIFTEINARKNNIKDTVLSAYTEPLLAGPPGQTWDLILSNVPAKAGLPVLEDFITRSIGLLNPGGRVLIVAVNTLSGFFSKLIANNASLVKQEEGSGHTVFLFEKKDEASRGLQNPASLSKDDFYIKCRGYIRNSDNYEMEKITYRLDTIHGAQGFDTPGGETQAAAKMTIKLKEQLNAMQTPPKILILSEDQGHYPAWLTGYLNRKLNFTLAGRNILALSMAKYNTAIALGENPETTEKIKIISTGDLYLEQEQIFEKSEGFDFISIFPELVPGTDRITPTWEALLTLTRPASVILAGFSSSEAERFDRKKLRGFTRLGDIKRRGFRALAYRRD